VAVITEALALRDIDTDAGVFTHEIKPYAAKLKGRHGYAARLETTWTANP
jgi:hypothetical protein